MRRTVPILLMMNYTANAQNWLDTGLYPFRNHFIQLQAGRIHYVDEGKGEILLFVHGTPAWSFLYRGIIKDLSKNYRCIAIDHIGFGLSDKPADLNGTPQAHSLNFGEFIEKLGLKRITLIVHDFGGPIGLGWAVGHPEKVKQVILFNTWLWKTASNPEAVKIDKLISSRLGRFLYLNLNFSPRLLLRKGFVNRKNLSRKVHQHYIKPFPDKASRQSLYKIARSLVGSSGWYQQQWEELSQLEGKPWLILWGMQDEFLKPDFLQKWKERLPQARIQTFDCGHFVQEEKTSETIEAIRKFLQNS